MSVAGGKEVRDSAVTIRLVAIDFRIDFFPSEYSFTTPMCPDAAANYSRA